MDDEQRARMFLEVWNVPLFRSLPLVLSPSRLPPMVTNYSKTWLGYRERHAGNYSSLSRCCLRVRRNPNASGSL